MVSRATPLLAALLFVLASCGDRAPSYELQGHTMGTQFSVTVAQPMERESRQDLQRDIEAVLEEVEDAMSTYRADSEVSRFNASPSTDWFAVSPATCEAIRATLEVSRLSDGAFDVTVGPLVNLWGFGPDPVRVRPPPDREIEDALASVGYRLLHADCERPAIRKDVASVYVDLSAYAKGLGVDRVGGLLEQRGIRGFMVEIGGELTLRGLDADGEPWTIAIETPESPGRGIGRVVSLTDRAMATSGDYRNFFEYDGRRYSHTIDPRTGRPTTHDLASVTVIGETAARADAMATALLVSGPEEGFDLAVRERIPAIFQIRTHAGYTERRTPAFSGFE